MNIEEIEKEFEIIWDKQYPQSTSYEMRVNRAYAKIAYLAGRRKGLEREQELEDDVDKYRLEAQKAEIIVKELEANLAYWKNAHSKLLDQWTENLPAKMLAGRIKELEEGIRNLKSERNYEGIAMEELYKLIEK